MNDLIKVFLAFVFAISLTQVNAQESETGHSHKAASAHGGEVTMTRQHHFEVVPVQEGITVFVYNYTQEPVELSTAITHGSVTLITKDGERRKLTLLPYGKQSKYAKRRTTTGPNQSESHQMEEQHGDADAERMHDEEASHGYAACEHMTDAGKMPANLLWCKEPLKKIGTSKVKASIVLQDLPSEDEPKVEFRQTLSLQNLPENLSEILQMSGEEMHHTNEEEHHHSDKTDSHHSEEEDHMHNTP